MNLSLSDYLDPKAAQKKRTQALSLVRRAIQLQVTNRQFTVNHTDQFNCRKQYLSLNCVHNNHQTYHMLKTALVSLSLVFTLASCSKDNDTDNSKTTLLTSRTWVYDLYITDFSKVNSIYQYKKGKPNNPLNLSGDWLKYEKDGTYTRRDYQGQMKSGTWAFVDGETGVTTTEDGVTHTNTIRSLTSDRYVWFDPISDTYGEMVPQ